MKYKIKNIFYKLLIIILLVLLYYFNLYSDNNIKIQKRVENISNEKLKIYFLDVGQADCILINVENEYALIDAGNNEDGEKIVSFIKNEGIEEFKYVIGTHAHEDHIGGMDNIIRNFKVNNFFMPDVITTTKTYEEVLDELKYKNIKYKTPRINDNYKLGSGNIKILYIGNDKEDLNENSIILRLTYKDTSYLFTGDAPYYTENTLLDKNIESDVLKVAHHGSAYSSSSEFINKVKPKYAIIQVGKNNDYSLPKEKTLNKLKKVNATILRTDQKGTIIVKSDGENIEIETIKTDTNGEEK